LPGAKHLDVGAQDPERCQDPGIDVRDRYPRLHRRPVRLPGDADQARVRLQDQVEAAAVGERTLVTVARDAADDEPWIGSAQRIAADAKLLHGPGPEIL